MMRKDIEDRIEEYGCAPYIEGNYLIVTLPIHQPKHGSMVNANGVAVGDDSEWSRIKWSDILGAVEPDSEAKA